MTEAYVLEDGFSPPDLPPLSTLEQPPPPPPPPSPPRPRLPTSESDRIVYVEPTRVTLSTYFVADHETGASTASTATGNLMPLTNLANATRNATFARITNEGLPYERWAACSTALVEANAPLPCRTGDEPGRCVDGHRRCTDVASNTRAPFFELDLRAEWPTDRDYYFFGLDLVLPTAPVYAALFFESSQGGDANRFYELSVMDETHNPLATQCKPYYEQSVDHYTDGLVYVSIVCLEALAEDADYAAMRNARFVRLTLTGEYRQLWLERIRVVTRALTDEPPSPPPTPALPPPPPLPGAPPDAPAMDSTYTCEEHPLQAFDASVGLVATVREPCHVTPAVCCAYAYQRATTLVYELSASGCCTLYELDSYDASVAAALADGTIAPTVAFGYGAAQTGVRRVVI